MKLRRREDVEGVAPQLVAVGRGRRHPVGVDATRRVGAVLDTVGEAGDVTGRADHMAAAVVVAVAILGVGVAVNDVRVGGAVAELLGRAGRQGSGGRGNHGLGSGCDGSNLDRDRCGGYA